jgi:hypothetical protein
VVLSEGTHEVDERSRDAALAADPELGRRLERWHQAGLLDVAQVDAIRRFETAAPAPAAVDPRPARTSVAEAIGYVGAALVLAAVALFLGQVWEDLSPVGHLALASVVTIAFAGAASALVRSPAEALQRLVSVLAAGVVAGGAWAASIVAYDLAGWREQDAVLVTATVALALAVPAYLARRRLLPQTALLASVLAVVASVLTRQPVVGDPFWLALPFAAVGGVWVLLGTGGYLRPEPVATTLGSLVVLLALLTGSFGDHRLAGLLLAVAVAGVLVAAAVVTGALRHLVLGALGLFVFVPQLVFEVFGDAIGAPATLLLVGVLLVLLAVGLGRARREVVAQGGAA